MRSVEIPMWSKEMKLSLSDVLDKVIAPEKLDWILFDLIAAGQYPIGDTMESFEKLVRSSPFGYKMNYLDVLNLASGLTDWTSISLIGKKDDQMVIEIEADDSTRWSIRFDSDWFDPSSFE